MVLGRLLKWFFGICAVALGSFIGAYFTGLLDDIIPPDSELTCFVKEQFNEPAPGTHFAVLISTLEGDPDNRQTGHVVSALRSEEAGTAETMDAGGTGEGNYQDTRPCRAA